ncbi:hypothetical protein OSTOST_04423, partial [Ostertagia ostertagi]
MSGSIMKPIYQMLYILIPTISIVGNSLIVYVTIRSDDLKSACHVMIGLISFCDVLHAIGHYIMVISHN